MSQWYVIRTATRREYDANTQLFEAGVPFFVPSDTHDRKLKGEVEVIVRPRYAGYGFVQCEPDDIAAILEIRYVHDVLRYVTSSGLLRPLPVPSHIVASLFEAQWEGRFDRRSVDYIPARGDHVKLTGGMWAALGYVFEVTSITTDKRRALLTHKGWKFEEDTAHLVAA
jgi:transcription antitermination factor NusG